jgi:hypothetical protein
MDRQPGDIAKAIEKILDEGGGVDVPHGEHFDDLVALIVDELGVQLQVAIESKLVSASRYADLSDVVVDPETVTGIAEMIALEVDYMFTLAPRNFQPFD